jgi:hypothetical protein
MWFLPLGLNPSDGTIAESNSDPLSSEAPQALPVTTIAAFVRNTIKPLDYIPPTPSLLGEGGALAVSGGFRTHTYTGVGSSTFTVNLTTPFDPYA